MKKTIATQARRRKGSRKIRKLRRFLRGAIPIFALVVLGVMLFVIIFKLVAMAAPISVTQEQPKSYGFDLSEASRIQSQHQSEVEERRASMRDSSMQIATGQSNEEVAVQTAEYEQVGVSTTTTNPAVHEAPAELTTDSQVSTVEPVIPAPRLSEDGPGESYYYIITYEEKMLIAKVVWVEARGESFEGQVAVAATIFILIG